MTFEQILENANKVADKRTKVAKDFINYALTKAIPKLCEANQKLGFKWLEVWHDNKFVTNQNLVGDGDVAHRYATRFYFDEELLVEEAGRLDYYNGVEYGEFVLVTSLDKVSFLGVLKVLPKLLTELERNIARREKEIQKAESLMTV